MDNIKQLLKEGVTQKENKDWITYSLALYTCAKAEEKQNHFLKAYQNIEKAYQIVYEILGENNFIAQKYNQFQQKLAKA